MSDISKCNGRDCPIKETCYRFTAPTNTRYQSYGDFDERKEGFDCGRYWERKNGIADEDREGLA